MSDYCNINTDLTDVFDRIEDYKLNKVLETWVAHSDIYKKAGTGYVNLVLENDIQLTEKTSIATVEATVATFWYDADADILYLHTSTGAAPSGFRITGGSDWDTFKTGCRDDAMEWVDSAMNKRYPTPLQPRITKDHSANDYELPIRRATAALACHLIVSRKKPGDDMSMSLLKIAFNSEPEDDELKGILDQYMDGDIVRQDEVSAREASSFNYYPGSGNTTDEPGLILEGSFTGINFQIWLITITTGGAPGTAIFKLSLDNGTTDTYTGLETLISGKDVYVDLSQGVRARFPAATYVQTDTWQIESLPSGSSLQKHNVFETITVSR